MIDLIENQWEELYDTVIHSAVYIQLNKLLEILNINLNVFGYLRRSSTSASQLKSIKYEKSSNSKKELYY